MTDEIEIEVFKDVERLKVLRKETGILTDDDTNEIEVSILVQSGRKKEKIIASCRTVYIAKNDDIEGENSFVVGLQVIDFKGKSLDIIKRLIRGLDT